MSSGANSLDVPPYQLRSLIHSVVQIDEVRPAGKGGPLKVEVTCVQALGSEVYIGCSDGGLYRYALQADDPNTPESYKPLSQQTVPTNKAVDKLVLIPNISRALVLTDHIVHFYTLPALDLITPQHIRPIRNAIHLAVDELKLRLSSEPNAPKEATEFCVIKRNAIQLFSLRERLINLREIPLPAGATFACRLGQQLIIADNDNYNMVDLTNSTMIGLLPVCQVPEEPPAPVRPLITVVKEDEMLLLSHIGPSSLGLCINQNGDPVRAPIQWENQHPVSLCVDYPYIVALMPDQSLSFYHLETETFQAVPLSQPHVVPSSPTSPSPVDIHSLIPCVSPYFVPSSHRTDKIKLVSIPLVVQDAPDPKAAQSLPSSATSSQFPAATKPSSTPRTPILPKSNMLAFSSNSILSLLPSTLISQAEALLELHHLEEAVDLADQNQRMLLSNIAVDEEKDEELRYIYQRVAFQCFSETLWDDAGRHFISGEVDPRLIIRYFPDVRGNLFDASTTVDLYAGVAQQLTPYSCIDEIIIANLVRNYSPHLSPNTREASPTAELRHTLNMAAKDMLGSFLRKCRMRRLLDRSNANGGPKAKAINAAVDTVLAKLFAESEDSSELYALLEGPNDVVLAEVEEPLEKNGHYNVLCKLYEATGQEAKLLEVWSKLANGVWKDAESPDPLGNMVTVLQKSQNRELVQRWGIWLTRREPKIGVQLLISRAPKRSTRAEDAAMLQRIQGASPEAGQEYLEYLVLRKQSDDVDLHAQLVKACLDQLLQSASDEATSKLWRAKASSYRSTRNDMPFVTYFASTTPESEHKRIRLKALLLLQGSSSYDATEILERLREHSKLLPLEIAILYGKLGMHQDALSILVHEMGDSTTAEAYCTLGGAVIPGKVAAMLGEKYDLRLWAALVTGTSAALRPSTSTETQYSSASKYGAPVDEATKTALLRVLMQVYMSGGEATADRTACLLNSQAMNLDVVDVISLVPPDWSLNVISSFLTRSFRRALHERNEGQIIKAVSSGQNIEVADESWSIIREYGYVVEEAADDAPDDEKDSAVPGEEPESFNEKTGVPMPNSVQDAESVLEIRVGSQSSTANVPSG